MNKPATLLDRLRQRRLLWNLLLIAAVMLALAVAAHLVMQAGTRHGARRTVPDFAGIRLDEAQRCSSPPTRAASSSTSFPKGAWR